MGVLAAVHRQRPPRQVGIGQVEAGDLHCAHGMDGDQADDDSRGGPVQPVQHPGRPVARQRQRQVDSGERLDPGGGITEDQLLLLQGTEDTAPGQSFAQLGYVPVQTQPALPNDAHGHRHQFGGLSRRGPSRLGTGRTGPASPPTTRSCRWAGRPGAACCRRPPAPLALEPPSATRTGGNSSITGPGRYRRDAVLSARRNLAGTTAGRDGHVQRRHRLRHPLGRKQRRRRGLRVIPEQPTDLLPYLTAARAPPQTGTPPAAGALTPARPCPEPRTGPSAPTPSARPRVRHRTAPRPVPRTGRLSSP